MLSTFLTDSILSAGDMEEERPTSARRKPTKNPYRRDPVLDSADAVKEFMETCDRTPAPAAIPINMPVKNSCSCGQCKEKIVWRRSASGEEYEHPCCRQLKTRWWDQKTPEPDTCCVTEAASYKDVTNVNAVKNLLFVSWAYGRKKMEDQGQALSDPPSHENLRYGSYKEQPFVLEPTGIIVRPPGSQIFCVLFDHPLAEGQEKNNFLPDLRVGPTGGFVTRLSVWWDN
jgi:hypothetical protein